MAIPPKLEGSAALLALAPLFPYRVYPNDELAIYAVLEMLIANEEPPRVDVTRVNSDWLDRPPYPNGRLFIRAAYAPAREVRPAAMSFGIAALDTDARFP